MLSTDLGEKRIAAPRMMEISMKSPEEAREILKRIKAGQRSNGQSTNTQGILLGKAKGR